MSFNLSQNSPSRKVHYKILSTQNINKDMSSSGNDICSRLENVKLSSQETQNSSSDHQNSSSQRKTPSTPKKRGFNELSCLRRSYSVDFGLSELTSYPCKRKILQTTVSLQQLCEVCDCELEDENTTSPKKYHRCPNCSQRDEATSAPIMSNNPITPISLSDLEQTDEESDVGCFV